MVDRWLIANKKAEDIGNWKILESFYREDAIYCWNMGPNQEFVARSREEIREYALGYWMKGFEGWNYPYHDVIIDEKRGTVVAFWEQIAPGKRADGTPYKVAGCQDLGLSMLAITNGNRNEIFLISKMSRLLRSNWPGMVS